MLTEPQRRFLECARVGRLATADRRGQPHVVPVCFALSGDSLYIAIDQKPKRREVPLKRERNIRENPQAAFVADHYDEDWTRLGWVMLRGRAELLDAGDEHAHAQTLCQARYRQLQAMDLAGLPVIALRIERVAGWGDLSIATGD